MDKSDKEWAEHELAFANALVLAYWGSIAQAHDARCEIVIMMQPTNDPGLCVPIIYTHPEGKNPRELAPILRHLASEIEAGRAYDSAAERDQHEERPVKRGGANPWGGAVCLACGESHGLDTPCGSSGG